MSFYAGVSRSWHRALHFCAVLLGLCTGYAYVIGNIVARSKEHPDIGIYADGTLGTLIGLIVVSGGSILFFIAASILDSGFMPPVWRRRLLFVEFLGLFYYIMSLIFCASTSGAFTQLTTFR